MIFYLWKDVFLLRITYDPVCKESTVSKVNDKGQTVKEYFS